MDTVYNWSTSHKETYDPYRHALTNIILEAEQVLRINMIESWRYSVP